MSQSVKIQYKRSDDIRRLGAGHDKSKTGILKDQYGKELVFPNRKAARNYVRNRGGLESQGWSSMELVVIER